MRNRRKFLKQVVALGGMTVVAGCSGGSSSSSESGSGSETSMINNVELSEEELVLDLADGHGADTFAIRTPEGEVSFRSPIQSGATRATRTMEDPDVVDGYYKNYQILLYDTDEKIIGKASWSPEPSFEYEFSVKNEVSQDGIGSYNTHRPNMRITNNGILPVKVREIDITTDSGSSYLNDTEPTTLFGIMNEEYEKIYPKSTQNLDMQDSFSEEDYNIGILMPNNKSCGNETYTISFVFEYESTEDVDHDRFPIRQEVELSIENSGGIEEQSGTRASNFKSCKNVAVSNKSVSNIMAE